MLRLVRAVHVAFMCHICTSMSRLWCYRLARFHEASANKLQSSKYGDTSIKKWEVSNLVRAFYTLSCLPFRLLSHDQHAPAQHLCCCHNVMLAMQRYAQQNFAQSAINSFCQTGLWRLHLPHIKQAASQQHCLPCCNQSLPFTSHSCTAHLEHSATDATAVD